MSIKKAILDKIAFIYMTLPEPSTTARATVHEINGIALDQIYGALSKIEDLLEDMMEPECCAENVKSDPPA